MDDEHKILHSKSINALQSLAAPNKNELLIHDQQDTLLSLANPSPSSHSAPLTSPLAAALNLPLHSPISPSQQDASLKPVNATAHRHSHSDSAEPATSLRSPILTLTGRDNLNHENRDKAADTKNENLDVTTLSKSQVRFLKHFPDRKDEVASLVKAHNGSLNRDGIIWQGKLFLTSAHYFFFGRNGSKAAKLAIRLHDIISISEKQSDDGVPTGVLKILTLMGKYEFGDFSKREEAYTDVMGVWQTSLNTMKRSKSKHERTTSSISSPILPDFPRSDLPANIASESTNEASTVKEQNDSQKSPANPSMVTKPSMEFSKSSSGLVDASKKGDGTEINQLTSKSKPPLPIPIPDRAAPSTTLVDVNVTSYPVVPMRQQSLHQSTLPSKPLPETQPQAPTSSNSSSPIPVTSATSPLPPLPLLNGQVPRKTTMNELFRSLGRKMKVGLDKDGVNGAGSGHGTPTGMASGVVSGNGSSAALIVGTPPSISVASDSTLVQALSTPPKSTDNRLEKAVNESAPPTDSSLPSQAPAGEPPITKPTIVYPPAPIPFDFEPFYKHVVLNEIIPLEINILWELVWSDRNNEVLKEAHKRRETEGVKIGEWKVVGDGSEVEKKGRELGYSVMYKMPMQPKKWAQCTETQTITKFDPFLKVFSCTSCTPTVPFGDHFTTHNRVSLSYVSPTSTRLHVSTMTKFIKSTMWESKIEKGAVDGSTGYYVEVKNVVLEMIKSGRVNNGGGGIIGKMEVGKNGEVGKEDEVNLSTTNDNSGGKDGVLSKGSAGPDILSTTTTTVTETTVMRSTGEWFTVGSVIQKTVRLVSSGFNFIPFSPLSLFRASPSPLPESKSKTKSRKSRSSRSSKSNRETDTQKPKIKSKSLLLLLLTIVSLVNLIQVVSLLEKLTILVSFSSSSTMDENGLEFGAGSLIPNVGQRNSNGGADMQKDIEIPSGTEHKGGVLDNISNKFSRRNSKINLLWRRLKILKKEMDEIWEVVSTVEGGNIGRGDGTEVENHVKV